MEPLQLSALSMALWYFLQRRITLVTLLLCDPQMATTAGRLFISHGLRVNWIHGDIDLPFLGQDRIWKAGVLVDTTCDSSVEALKLASNRRYFDIMHHWILIDDLKSFPLSINETNEEVNNKDYFDVTNITYNISPRAVEVLSGVDILMDCEALWLQAISPSELMAFEIYRLYYNLPWETEAFLRASDEGVTANVPLNLHTSERSNLKGTSISTGVIEQASLVSENKTENWMDINMPLIEYLQDEMNFSINIQAIRFNGSLDGILEQFEQRGIEITAAGIFMQVNTYALCEYAMDTFELSTAIIFLSPSLSLISNIFLLPFETDVWVACMVTTMIAFFCLYIQIRITKRIGVEQELNDSSWLHQMFSLASVICQQGYEDPPTSLSGRTSVFVANLTALFLFTSYSANVVSLLQSSVNSITTLEDFIQSPFKIGIQNVSYNRIFFQETQETLAHKLYDKKIAPLGEKSFLQPSEGIKKVQAGMFGFQVEKKLAYNMLIDMYSNQEICGIQEIKIFSLPPMAFAMRKKSSFREYFAKRLRWYIESGMIDRLSNRQVVLKPTCEDGIGGFDPIGIRDIYPALKAFEYGLYASGILLLFEKIFSQLNQRIEGINLEKCFC